MIASFVRGLSVRDVEAALAEALGDQAAISQSTVSAICQQIKDEYQAWAKRRLDDVTLDYLIEVLGSAPGDAQPFGIRIVVHATPRGPRRVAAISESVIDGTIAAFHAGTSTSAAASVAAALAPHLPGVDPASIETLAAMSSPGPCSPHPHLRSKAHMCRSARVTSDATSGR